MGVRELFAGLLTENQVHKLVKALYRRHHTLTPRWRDRPALKFYSTLTSLTSDQALAVTTLLVKYADTDLPGICKQLNQSPLTKTILAQADFIPLPSPLNDPLPVGTSEVRARPGFKLLMPRDREWIIPTTHELGLYIPWIKNHERNEEMRNAIKEIPGRRWDPGDKRWFIPIIHARIAADAIKPFFPELAEALQQSDHIARHEQQELLRNSLSSATTLDDFDGYDELDQELDDIVPEGLQLYPHQKACVAFIREAGGKALIADEMGLGKTIEALAYTWDLEGLHHEFTLIACPNNVKFNWANEIRKWAPNHTVGVYMANMTKRDEKYWRHSGITIIRKDDSLKQLRLDYVVVNYEHIRGKPFTDPKGKPSIELSPFAVQAFNFGFMHFILDECHRIGNYKTQQTQGCLHLARAIDNIIGLTGTPIRNRPSEFFTLLHLIRPTDFPNWNQYVLDFCDGQYEDIEYSPGKYRTILHHKGSSNWHVLSEKLKGTMMRREKKQVLKDLPSKIRQIVEVPLTKPSHYYKTEKDLYWEYYQKPGAQLAIISGLRAEVGYQKLDHCIELAKDVIASEGYVVIFYHHLEIGGKLAYELDRLKIGNEKIDGSIAEGQRQRNIENFQAGKIPVLLIGTLAGGIGITLTRASTAIFLEPEWSPADVVQAEDRLHRIGQVRNVHIIHLKAPGTIDDLFYDHLLHKADITAQVIDGKEQSSRMISVCMDQLRGKYA